MVSSTAVRFGLLLALIGTACSPGGQGRARAARTAPPADATVIRVTTDAHEKIVDVTVIQSSGSSARDRHAVADTRGYWHGTVSSIQKVAVRYTPGPDGQPAPTFQLSPR